MMLDVVKTPLEFHRWKLEVRHPLLFDLDGPGYRVIFSETYNSRKEMEDDLPNVRSQVMQRQQ